MLLLTVKVIVDKGRPMFWKIPKGQKSETAMVHKNKTEISSQYNLLECVMLIASAEILAGKRCDFSWP